MITFFDTETTGLPKNFNAPVSDLKNWPRMIQLAWVSYNDTGTEKLDEKSVIIRPEDFIIPQDASNVHGITTERALSEGIELTTALEMFAESIANSSLLVAHNMSFDEKIVGAEFLRKDIKNSLFERKRFCTMKATTEFVGITNYYGYKWPNLTELHTKVFGKGFDKAHDALGDITATANCYWELKKRGVL